MKLTRRNFLESSIASSIAMTLGAHPLHLAASEGYELVDPPQNTTSDTQVEVLEFFWLGCPHCYDFEPYIEQWKENSAANVSFRREAPPLNTSWMEHSRSFYAARTMGAEQIFVEAMFEAIHEDGKRMRSPDEIADLAQEIGLERKRFLSAMASFAIDTKIKRAIQLAKSASISAVPSVIINGKYRTTSRLAGDYAGIIDVINSTVALEKQAMGLE